MLIFLGILWCLIGLIPIWFQSKKDGQIDINHIFLSITCLLGPINFSFYFLINGENIIFYKHKDRK